jgi:hypothetical protein
MENGGSLRALTPASLMASGGPTATASTRKPCASRCVAVVDASGDGCTRLTTAAKAPLTARTVAPPASVPSAHGLAMPRVQIRKPVRACFDKPRAFARLLVFLSFPAMQRWIVKDFLQAGSLQRAGLGIDMPIFCQDPRLIQIVICDVQRRTVK